VRLWQHKDCGEVYTDLEYPQRGFCRCGASTGFDNFRSLDSDQAQHALADLAKAWLHANAETDDLERQYTRLAAAIGRSNGVGIHP